jgi:exopolyphosphatase/guanosine-5'-triphosphate,3'-diphosphate pyrophosphatase
MTAKSIHLISSKFALLKPEKITRISSISNGRAETIAAGSCVIDMLMSKLKFDHIVVSAQGLREGTLSLSLEYPKEFAIGKIDQEHIQNSIRYSYESDVIPQHMEDMVRFLISAEMITERERLILAHSLRNLSNSRILQNITNFLSLGMDADSKLDHHDQLVSVLSTIYSKKKKRLDKIFDRFDSILQQSDKRSIRKISSLILLAETLNKSETKIKAKMVDNRISMKIYPAISSFPSVLFKDICEKISDAFNVEITHSIIQNSRYSTSQTVESL